MTDFDFFLRSKVHDAHHIVGQQTHEIDNQSRQRIRQVVNGVASPQVLLNHRAAFPNDDWGAHAATVLVVLEFPERAGGNRSAARQGNRDRQLGHAAICKRSQLLLKVGNDLFGFFPFIFGFFLFILGIFHLVLGIDISGEVPLALSTPQPYDQRIKNGPERVQGQA